MDEATKLKKLKEEEKLNLKPDEVKKKPFAKRSIALAMWLFLAFLCLAGGAIVTFRRFTADSTTSPSPARTPTSPATVASGETTFVSEDGFEVSINSLSASLPPQTTSTTSFLIRRKPTDRPVCSGRYRLIDLSHGRKLHEKDVTEKRETAVKGLWLSLAAYDEETVYKIGDETPLYDGNVGITDFHLGNEPEFRQASHRFSDGLSDWVILDTAFMAENDRANGGTSEGIPESHFFQRDTDLQSHSIDLIRREIHQLVIQPTYYTLDMTWSLWEYTPAEGDSWLQMTPTAATVLPGSSSEVSVTLAAASLAAGKYRTDLLLDFGQNCTPPLLIPVTMTVTHR